MITYNTPSALAFANAVGQQNTDGVLTITAGGFSITTDDATPTTWILDRDNLQQHDC